VNLIEFGDCRDIMRRWHMLGFKVQTCVTSPPYFGLRDYGHAGQLGLEKSPDEYVRSMVEVFRCVRDVLADDGMLWLNLGDSYAANRGYQVPSTLMNGDATNAAQAGAGQGMKAADLGLKPKDLIGIPWRVAFALQSDGWYLRQDIIWAKPNPMPESVTDRCTKSHEYIFMLTKRERYYYDHEAVKEPVAASTIARLSQDVENQRGSDRVPGKTNGPMKAVGGSRSKQDGHGRRHAGFNARYDERVAESGVPETRNRRSVWTVATRPYKGAHFATFPPDLIEPCILAGAPPGGIVLDPFMGSGTTAAVAVKHGRQYLGCELNPEYEALQKERLSQ
jgi:DNA modification methylase